MYRGNIFCVNHKRSTTKVTLRYYSHYSNCNKNKTTEDRSEKALILGGIFKCPVSEHTSETVSPTPSFYQSGLEDKEKMLVRSYSELCTVALIMELLLEMQPRVGLSSVAIMHLSSRS